MVKRFITKTYMGLIFLFLYAPILVLMVFSFNSSKSRGNFSGVTFKWYVELFQNQEVMRALSNTLIIGVVSTLVATFIGTFAAIGIYFMKKGYFKKLVLNLNYLPVLNPDIVMAVSLAALYKIMGLKLGLVTIILSHITFSIPYVVLAILPKLKQMNNFLVEAAMDLGAKPLYAVRKIIIPEIKESIVVGLLIAFTLSIDDFAISFFTTGHGVSNLSILIYSMAKKGINPMINALSTLMMITLFAFLVIIYKKNEKVDIDS
ncbi:MAG: ABC transporter permease [Clostridium sp.]|nr:ABC transporter permease [Clostridium sp.]